MRPLFALALILGCSSSAPGPDSPDAGAALDVAPDVVAADVGVDAGEDAGPACPFNFIRCGGVCVFAGNEHCGACGNACTGGMGCCIDGARSRCRFNCNE